MIVFLDDDVPRDAPRELKPWGKPFRLQTAWHTAFPWADLDNVGKEDTDDISKAVVVCPE